MEKALAMSPEDWQRFVKFSTPTNRNCISASAREYATDCYNNLQEMNPMDPQKQSQIYLHDTIQKILIEEKKSPSNSMTFTVNFKKGNMTENPGSQWALSQVYFKMI
jgi:hypothetical protein